MPVLTTLGMVSTGHAVQRRGEHNKWVTCAVYCDAEAAETAIARLWGHNLINDRPRECRVIEVAV